MKKPYNWLENFQKGNKKIERKGYKLSKVFFVGFTDKELLTARFHEDTYKKNAWKCVNPKEKDPKKQHFKHKGYEDRNIIRLYNLWKKEGFIEESINLKGKKKNRYGTESEYSFNFYILNLEPIFRFCKENGYEFTKEEKLVSYFIFDLKGENQRAAILAEFPYDNIIDAFLKFHVKNCINRYFYYLRDIRENPQKYSYYENKKDEMNNPTKKEQIMIKKEGEKIIEDFAKKLKLPLKKSKFDIIKLIAMDLQKYSSRLLGDFAEKNIKKNFTITEVMTNPIKTMKKLSKKNKQIYIRLFHDTIIYNIFYAYIREIENNKEMMASIDSKILSSLGVGPDNSLKIIHKN